MADNKPPASYADFTDEPSQGWLRTAVQFFAIPLLIVCVAVAIYVGINMMVGAGPKTASDFVALLQSDTINRRWQAAYELAARLGGPGEVPDEFRDERLVAALTNALEQARADPEDPPKLAILVLRILRRLEDPRSLPAVRDALDDRNDWIRSHAILVLAALGDDMSRPKFVELAKHDDAGTRQAALEALASLDQLEGADYRLSRGTKELALAGLGDPSADVRFTAALILAHAREREAALPVLKKMLDREYLASFPFDDRWGGLDRHKLRSKTILQAIRALSWLDGPGDDPEVAAALRRLTDDTVEGDFVVRDAARDALARLEKNKQ